MRVTEHGWIPRATLTVDGILVCKNFLLPQMWHRLEMVRGGTETAYAGERRCGNDFVLRNFCSEIYRRRAGERGETGRRGRRGGGDGGDSEVVVRKLMDMKKVERRKKEKRTSRAVRRKKRW